MAHWGSPFDLCKEEGSDPSLSLMGYEDAQTSDEPCMMTVEMKGLLKGNKQATSQLERKSHDPMPRKND
jgi:hypothetical protein